MNIAGSATLITGASTGIGAATAEALARQGGRLALVARRKELLDEVAARCKQLGAPDALVLPADLSDLEAAEAVALQADDALGGLDVVVNNAGAAKRKHVTRTSFEEVVATMTLNYLSPVRISLALLPRLVGRGKGVIVNIGSLAGRIGAPIEAAYAGSKFALTGFSESMFVDLAGSGVRVAVVQPGTIDTPLWEPAPGDEKPLYEGEMYPASDVADAVVQAIQEEKFEYFVPAELHPLMAFKAGEIDTFLEGAIAFAAAQQGAAPGQAAP